MGCSSCQKGQILRVERGPSSSGSAPRPQTARPTHRVTAKTVLIKPASLDKHRA